MVRAQELRSRGGHRGQGLSPWGLWGLLGAGAGVTSRVEGSNRNERVIRRGGRSCRHGGSLRTGWGLLG